MSSLLRHSPWVARLWPCGRTPEGRNGGRVTGRQPFLTRLCRDPPVSARLTQAKAGPFLTQALLSSELFSCRSPPTQAPLAQQPPHCSSATPASSCLWRCSSSCPLSLGHPYPQYHFTHSSPSGSAHITAPQTPPSPPRSLFLLAGAHGLQQRRSIVSLLCSLMARI